MGVHFLNGALMDGEVKPDAPEALIYEFKNGVARLVGVEFIVTFDAWHATHAESDVPVLEGQLLQFVDTTEMHVIGREEVVADAAIAELLHCKRGQAWDEITILRKVPQHKLPLSYLQVYVRPEYADAIGPQRVFHAPIYSLLEERHGVRIVEVEQEIAAAALTRPMARALKAAEGQAALRISRYYFDRSGSIVEVGIGHYPSGRYTQRSRFRAHGGDGSA